jgi:hypothetical protein
MNGTRVRGFNALPNIDLPGTSFDFLNDPLNNLTRIGIGYISGQQPNNPGAPGNVPPPVTTAAPPATNWTPLIIGGVAVAALLMFLKK